MKDLEYMYEGGSFQGYITEPKQIVKIWNDAIKEGWVVESFDVELDRNKVDEPATYKIKLNVVRKVKK